MERKCPNHIGTGLTPTNANCHAHKSTTQQIFHNFHCRLLKCPHAKKGEEKHTDVKELPPRNRLEKILKKLDEIL